MTVLDPNTGKEVHYIVKGHVYVKVMDFHQKSYLKEIKISPGQRTWQWIKLEEEDYIDISDIDGRYCSFDNAINRAINNPYCTVYEFDSYAEMAKNWDKIKYQNTITTTYKEEEQQ